MEQKQCVGIILAIELDAILELYPNCRELSAPVGFKLYTVEKEHCDIFILRSGMGEIAAAAGVQYLISRCGVSAIINFGVVGGLSHEMKLHKICLVEQVVHYKFDCSEFMELAVGQVDGHDSIYLRTDRALFDKARALAPELPAVTCCSGDKFVATESEKLYLNETFGGDICDMESAGIVLACEMNAVPCLLFKAVSDGLSDGAEGFYNELQTASLRCLKAADSIIDSLYTE